MKVIGLIGGMSWESSAEYYRIINQTVRERLGGQHSAKVLMYSVEFQEIEHLQREDRWDEAAEILADAARRVENGGADFLLLCTNTMHKVADRIQEAVGIPLVHLADVTAHEVKARGIEKVALLGTRYTMEQGFYRDRLQRRHGLRVMVPDAPSRDIVQRIIYDELCLGTVSEASRRNLAGIIEEMGSRGAEGVILGCTELPMLIKQDDSPLPLFDTTRIHARRAVEMALAD